MLAAASDKYGQNRDVSLSKALSSLGYPLACRSRICSEAFNFHTCVSKAMKRSHSASPEVSLNIQRWNFPPSCFRPCR